MSFGSLHIKLYLILVLLVAILGLVFVNYLANKNVWQWDHAYSRVVELDKELSSTISQEVRFLSEAGGLSVVTQQHEQLDRSCLKCHGKKTDLIQKRIAFLSKLSGNTAKTLLVKNDVRSHLSALTDSVRYIHEHHIATLQNFLRRNKVQEESDLDGKPFRKSSVRSAPELDIIKQTVAIQHHLAVLSENFYSLSTSSAPLQLLITFKDNMASFIEDINMLEDYSLDAQDGILVEELLDSGRTFEQLFAALSSLEKEHRNVQENLKANHGDIVAALTEVERKIRGKRDALKKQIVLLGRGSVLFVVLLTMLIFLRSREIIRSLKGIVAETEKIECDLSYRIPEDPRATTEFQVVSRALNSMTQNIEQQTGQLEQSIHLAYEMAEKAEAANHAKSVFLSNMSHELRTPLNAILGYTQLFAGDSSLSLKQQSGVQTIHQSGEHLLMLINDILDLSKIEAGKMELVTTEFLLAEFLQGIGNIIRVRSAKKGIDFRYEPEETLPLAIEADELRLRQVILNLLSNAVKFTNSGFCVLRVQATMVGDGAVRLTVMVEDSGPGIPVLMQEKIFEPFQQIGERLQHSEGSGLGLVISRSLVHLMAGELQLVSPLKAQSENNEGPGSRFFFSIDVPVVATVPALAAEKNEVTGYSVPEGVNGQKRILVVDDNASNRAVLRDTLEPLGFVIGEAKDGSEVLEGCKEFQPDVILMDLRMPMVDGFTATGQIKTDARFSHVPVIAVTASVAYQQKLRQRCGEYGFSGYINKPYVAADLFTTLAEQLGIELHYVEEAALHTTESEIIAPPAEVLEELLQLVLSGNILAVTNQLTTIATLDAGKYKVFTQQLSDLAEGFQLMEIEQFIVKYQKGR